MKRGCRRPLLTGAEPRFAAALSQVSLAPQPEQFHNPNAAALSQTFLLNDSLPDCVVVSALRYCQRWDNNFGPSDSAALAIFKAAGGDPVNGLDPLAFMALWQSNALPHLTPIAGYAIVDLSDSTQCVQCIGTSRGLMVCLELAPDAEQTFPQPWLTFEQGGDGHCIMVDGFDQRAANVLFDRCTWADWTQGGINAEFQTACGFCGIVALPKAGLPGVDPAVLQAISNLGANQ